MKKVLLADIKEVALTGDRIFTGDQAVMHLDPVVLEAYAVVLIPSRLLISSNCTCAKDLRHLCLDNFLTIRAILLINAA